MMRNGSTMTPIWSQAWIKAQLYRVAQHSRSKPDRTRPAGGQILPSGNSSRRNSNQTRPDQTSKLSRQPSRLLSQHTTSRQNRHHEFRTRQPAAYAARPRQQASFRSPEVGSSRVQRHTCVCRQLHESAAVWYRGVCL